jgi:hypothetical protein
MAAMNERLLNHPVPPRVADPSISPQLQEFSTAPWSAIPKPLRPSPEFRLGPGAPDQVGVEDRPEIRDWQKRKSQLARKILYYGGLALIPGRHPASTGIADISYWGPEAEFYIFDDVRYDQTAHSGYYYVDSDEGVWNTGREEGPNLGYKLRHKEGYFPVPPSDQLQDLRSEIILALKEVGVKSKCTITKWAPPARRDRHALRPAEVKMADNLLNYKYIIRMICQEARHDGHLHAQAALRRQRLRHARAPEPVEGRHQRLLRRQGLRAAEPDREVLHRRPAQARAGAAGHLRSRPPTPIAAWCPATRRR